MEPFPRVIEIIETPTFLPGEIGCFDDCGVSYPWIVHTENEEKLYYTGWMRGIQTPFQNALGLAYRNGSSYERISRAPLLPRTNEEPFSSGSMCVLREKNNWQMWYTSFESWYKSNSGIEPVTISVKQYQWMEFSGKDQIRRPFSVQLILTDVSHDHQSSRLQKHMRCTIVIAEKTTN